MDSLKRASRNWLLHMIKPAGAAAFVIDERTGKWLFGDGEIGFALERERERLYDHLKNDKRAFAYATRFLNISEDSSFSDVKKGLKQGNLQEQLSRYDKLVERLVQKDLYEPKYDYRRVGWRQQSYLWHLAWRGEKLLNM